MTVLVSKIANEVVGCLGQLYAEVNDSELIVPECEQLLVDSGVDVTFRFASELTEDEDIALTSILNNLICDPKVEEDPVVRTFSNYQWADFVRLTKIILASFRKDKQEKR